jgi:hypothetical protein
MKLPDGTWVTTPMAVGVGGLSPQCPNDACAWEDLGPPTLPEVAGQVPVQLQKCSGCGWIRGRYLGNPHPEEEEHGQEDR